MPLEMPGLFDEPAAGPGPGPAPAPTPTPPAARHPGGRAPAPPPLPADALAPAGASDLESLLRSRFGHDSFREGQREIIEAVLAGRDVVAVMPTGGGKSLLYQLPALALPGVTVVVSPLIALMKDQVDALDARGIPATLVNSTLGPGEQDARLEAAARGHVKLLYLSPERFRNERFRAAVKRLRVSLLAVDEAHCVSQWGHDFRPDYRRLIEARELLGDPPVAALTATATPEVRADIVRDLALREPLTLVTGFDRKNLFLGVVQTPGEAQKMAALDRTIDEAGGCGIVYVASRKSAERVIDLLRARKRPAGLYHAGMAEAERTRSQDRFMSGECPLIVATNAFGMGIDKSDIRFVVHYEFPKSLEAYYQEVGRAGRDGKQAWAKLLFCYVDKRIQDFFIEGANPSLELVQTVYRCLLQTREPGNETTASAIAAAIGQKNDMAVGGALAVLERAQVVERMAPGAGPRGRARPYRVKQRVAPAALPVDGAHLQKKLESDRRKLDAVLQFAYASGCRKERLLAYFGDSRRLRTCASCDVCAGRAERSRPLSGDESAAASACLRAVRALDGRFGRMRIADVLQGVDEAAESPGAGALRHLGRDRVLGWLDALLDAGYLEKEELGRDRKGYVLRLSGMGQTALRDPATLAVDPPLEDVPRAKQKRTRERAARARADARPGERVDASVPPAAPAPSARILLALKAWRREEAKRRAVPAYVLFHDSVLEAIAAVRPATRTDLLALPGIGARKLEEYGEAVLEVVRTSA